MKNNVYYPLKLILWILIMFLLFIGDARVCGSYGLLYCVGGVIVKAVILIFIGNLFGNWCVDIATKNKKNINIAYTIGFIFSLVGLFIYWVYFKEKK